MIDLKHRPKFVYFLSAISIIGAIFNLIQISLRWDLGRWPLISVLIIIGAGLLVESQIRVIFKGGYKGEDVWAHLATGLIGGIALIVGIILIPWFGVALSGTVLSFTIIILTFHILSVLVELFII